MMTTREELIVGVGPISARPRAAYAFVGSVYRNTYVPTMPRFKTSRIRRPRVVIVPGLYDRYRKYQRHDLLGSLLLVNGKPVRSQWVNESTGAREPGERVHARDPHAPRRSDRPGIDLARRACMHTRCPRTVGRPPNRDFHSRRLRFLRKTYWLPRRVRFKYEWHRIPIVRYFITKK